MKSARCCNTYRLNKARDLDEWKAAMRLQALPSINYIYADEKGNIGYVYNGQFPMRKPGINWQTYLPGDRSDLIWHSYLPFDRMPQLWNPEIRIRLQFQQHTRSRRPRRKTI